MVAPAVPAAPGAAAPTGRGPGFLRWGGVLDSPPGSCRRVSDGDPPPAAAVPAPPFFLFIADDEVVAEHAWHLP